MDGIWFSILLVILGFAFGIVGVITFNYIKMKKDTKKVLKKT